jgi:5-methylcytosine-specific restriction endonuclease McrA
MFAFCVSDLGFSEDAAYNRILVARAARRVPAVIEAIRLGEVHLGGMRLLVPHLTEDNHQDVLNRATGKSKREIEELVARLSPQPPVPATVRKIPERSLAAAADELCLTAPELAPVLHPSLPGVEASPVAPAEPLTSASTPGETVPSTTTLAGLLASTNLSGAGGASSPHRDEHRAVIAPLTGETFRVQFTAGRELRDKLRQAQDLLRHRVPDGNVAIIIERALDVLIDEVKRERFAIGRKPRSFSGDRQRSESGCASSDRVDPSGDRVPTCSRHIPDSIKRAVFERDEGRCTFTDERGRRCAETGALEFDHVEGFARTGKHHLESIRLLCRAHNQHAADQTYGREFMKRARGLRESSRTDPEYPAHSSRGAGTRCP